MSMIGLFTATPQATGARVTTGTAATAAGFGSTLQGALDALAKGVAEESAPLGEPAEATPSLVELVETAISDPAGASTSSASDGAATPLVELVETSTGSSVPASTSSASDGAATPLVELVETSTGSSVPASTSSASGVVPAPIATPLVEPVETPTGNPVPASTSSATGVAPAVVVPLVDARTGSPLPSSTNPANGTVPASTTVAAGPTPPTPAGASAEPAPVQATTTIAAPASVPVQSTAPAAPAAPPAPAQPVPFTSQLARPIFSLAAAGAGEHVMTVSVTPDNLGPVTVRAHVGADGVRVELFAPNDLGRDAIRAIIPDLRRDLAGAGLGGNLSLSSQNQPTSDGSATGSHAGQPGERDAQRGTSAQASAAQADGSPATSEQEVDRAGLFGATSTIDVLA